MWSCKKLNWKTRKAANKIQWSLQINPPKWYSRSDLFNSTGLVYFSDWFQCYILYEHICWFLLPKPHSFINTYWRQISGHWFHVFNWLLVYNCCSDNMLFCWVSAFIGNTWTYLSKMIHTRWDYFPRIDYKKEKASSFCTRKLTFPGLIKWHFNRISAVLDVFWFTSVFN